ncbi:MAG: amidohydrolase [Verrucomicrobiales bacterium]|nr:amidohydrolase [Verrucomicrobiales bacterium]
MKTQSRRRFLTTTGTLAMTPALSLFGETPVGEGLIDAHVHVWTSDREKYPLSSKFSDKDVVPAVFDPAILLAEQAGTGVTRTVLIQMSFYEFDNRYMLDVIKADPERFRGVAIVDDSTSGVGERMKALAGKGVRGFRLYAFPDKTATWGASEGIQEMWKVGGEEGLAMCCLTDPESLPVIQEMCKKYPETPVVIDHFARVGMTGTVDEKALGRLLALAECENTFVKISAFYALGRKKPPYTDLAPMIRRVRDAFGSKRLMWGSDCPYQVQGEHTYKASVDLVQEGLDFLSAGEKADIMKGTAEKFFFR